MSKKKNKKEINPIEGVITLNSKGVGFMEHHDFEVDIEIPTANLNTALHKDKVLMSVSVDGPRPTGEVKKIIERNKTEFVGIYQTAKEYGFVDATDRRIYTDFFIPPGKNKKAKNGDKVLVKLVSWKDKGKNPEGEIVEVLGKPGDHEVEIRSIVLENNIDTSFPIQVEKEAENIKNNFNLEKELAENNPPRKDFRNVTTFTIDPVDAKDFDDALSIKELSDGDYEIGIHIADVSHFVREGSALDKEARDRNFSVYLVDRTIPMLPEVLSNDLCSLNPNEDKFAFSAVFVMDKNAKIKSRWFGKTVINSDRRFSYEEAQEIIDASKGDFAHELKTLNDLAHHLRKEKFSQGAIAFESDEVKFELDKNGKPIAIHKKQRKDTHKMIEDFMLLANREVAKFVYDKVKENGGFFLYRVHDNPDPDRLESLSLFLRALGYEFNLSDKPVSPKDINLLLQKIEGTDEESLIRTATIRSMAKAIYTVKNKGHFGLAFEYYTHFTSPIRRYPDLLVHRLLQKFIEGKGVPKQQISHYEKMAMDASEKEIEVAGAERESIKFKQAEYMQDHIGETREGIISGVTEWGIYIEDTETKSEGMARLSTLGDDYYVLDRKTYSIVGEKTKKKFTLGDRVKFEVVSANPQERIIDYKLA